MIDNNNEVETIEETVNNPEDLPDIQLIKRDSQIEVNQPSFNSQLFTEMQGKIKASTYNQPFNVDQEKLADLELELSNISSLEDLKVASETYRLLHKRELIEPSVLNKIGNLLIQKNVTLIVTGASQKFEVPDIVYLELKKGNLEMLSNVVEVFNNVDLTNFENYSSLLRSLSKFPMEENSTTSYVENITLSIMQRSGFSTDFCTNLLTSWKQSHSSSPDPFNYQEILSNLKMISQLETAYPGGVPHLSNKFGIRNFARYPEAMLFDLLRNEFSESKDNTKPQYLIVMPYSDNNGALYTNLRFLDNIYSTLKDSANLCIVESEDKYDLRSKMKSLPGKYSLIILGGHGTETGIQIGEHRDDGNISIQDIDVDRVPLVEKATPNGTIILQSCSTGAGNGLNIARRLSNQGLKVIAPSKNVTTNTFTDISTSVQGNEIVVDSGNSDLQIFVS